MSCIYKKSALVKCYGCGTLKRIYKCTKTDLVVTYNVCRFCKHKTTKEEQKRGNNNENIQSSTHSGGDDR
ncbi:MAG: hypothetical protein GX287_07185 [Fusobacteria bacterium]|nr:hypothetical protein [Fusobacteriota bacterium]